MTPAEMMERLQEEYAGVLTADGFDDALVGVVGGAGRPDVACYDYDRCARVLMERDGMSEEEAYEFIDFNTAGAYAGETTPLFLHDWRDEERSMDTGELSIRLELLKLAKEITEVNSLTGKPVEPGRQREPVYPSYTVDQVLLTARRLYEFVVGDQTEKAAT